MILHYILYHHKKTLRLAAVLMMVLLFSCSIKAQEPPPRPVSIFVNPAQGLVFGGFFQGIIGGTLIIYPDGSRSVTGDIIQANLGIPFSPEIFEIDANPGTLISILNGPDATLTGSNGGTLRLHIGSASTGAQFITTVVPPGRTQVRIGGTLTAGNALANPAGVYSGTFSITFIQQ